MPATATQEARKRCIGLKEEITGIFRIIAEDVEVLPKLSIKLFATHLRHYVVNR
jgi:hypothetical protein